MKTFRSVLVDDEWHARQNLKLLLEQYCPQIEVIDTADGLASGYELVKKHQPDILFTDIRMPSGAEGFELVTSIPKKQLQVVFVTAFKGFAVDALQRNHIDYLLKPIDIKELVQLFEKIMADRARFEASPIAFENYHKALDRLADSLTNG
ncbi:MAG: LytR/AlgR family response regulator transcription factor [Salibacteraceae bacterium]